jgi:hypothetical protein
VANILTRTVDLLMTVMMSTNFEATHCETFSILHLCNPSYVQIFCLELCSQSPSDAMVSLPLLLLTHNLIRTCTGNHEEHVVFISFKSNWEQKWL